MSVVVVGLNHNSAPVELLERLAIADDDLVKALHQLVNYEHVLEGVVLSTCNRVEVYAVVSKFHGGAQDLRNFLAEFCHVAPEDFADRLYTYHDEAALNHLFRVASGIDSMVIGESEILGQVRRTFQTAFAEGTAQRLLRAAFRKSLRVGKRARTETAIGRNPVSISSAAVELARRAFEDGSLAGRKVAVLGAGKMGRLAARALAAAGVSDVTVVNRGEERAKALAGAFEGTARSLDELPEVLATTDIVITSTTSPQTIVSRATVEAAVSRRTHSASLLIVDIAVPRDVDPGVREVTGVVLRDIDDLRGVVESSIGSRLSEVSKVEGIIREEIDSFFQWQRSTEIGPTASALVEWAESVRRAEVDKLVARWDLSGDQRAAFEKASKQIVARLLHSPLERAKELTSSKQGHLYLTALRELFELDDEES